jgi:hypothetical protein
MKMSHALLSAAVSGITLGLQAAVWAGPASAGQADSFDVATGSQLDMSDAGAKHACKGKNDCKSQGGCKSSKNGCKGKNDCKSQGGCRTDGK